MPNNVRPIQFHDHLPEVFRVGEDKSTFLSKFLTAFELVFEELEAAIEGTPGGMLQLTFQSATGTEITVTRFNTGHVGFPVGTTVTTASRHTTLKQAIPANQTGITRIEVEDDSFAAALETGDILYMYPGGIPDLFTGGIPDLFSPDKTPPPQFVHRSEQDFEYLKYLASWIALPLRTDVIQYEGEYLFSWDKIPGNDNEILIEFLKQNFGIDWVKTAKIEKIDDGKTIKVSTEMNSLSIRLNDEKTRVTLSIDDDRTDEFIVKTENGKLNVYEGETDAEYAARRTEWNRLFFKTAIPHNKERSTLPGMEWLLRAWLKDDMLQTTRPILTDLTRAHTDVDAIFQLGETATVGVDTVLGEGPPFFFIADLVTDPTVRELHNPGWLDVFQRAARFLLDAEKPAHTYYQLRVRAHTMQLAPENEPENDMDKTSDEVYAQLGETTLLWDAPWIYDSD